MTREIPLTRGLLDDLTVYGKSVGSMWDCRIGGRYELEEIHDRGGRGLWVLMVRTVGRDDRMFIPVSDLGRDFVCVPEKAEPAVPEPVKPADEPSLGLATTRQLLAELTARIDVDGANGGGGLDYKTVSGRLVEPAPTPPLPWVEHPRAWWLNTTGVYENIYPSIGLLGSDDEVAEWQRVAVIPAGLIEQLRRSFTYGTRVTDADLALLQKIADAADGATS